MIETDSNTLSPPIGDSGMGKTAGNARRVECSVLDHLFMGLLIWSSGNPAFLNLLNSSQMTYIGVFIFFALLDLNLVSARPQTVGPVLKTWSCFLVLALIHLLAGIPIQSELGMLVRTGIAGLAAIRLYDKFAYLYLKWMLVISKISLFFWVCSLCNWLRANSPIVAFFSRLHNQPNGYLLINTFHPVVYYRNCGIFWEPGAFAGYLILAMLFLFLYLPKDQSGRKMKSGVLLMITLGSTLSTTGFIAFFCFTVAYIVIRFKGRIVAMSAMLIIVLGLTIPVFYNVDFMSDKISREIEVVDNSNRYWQITRYGSLIADLEYIREKPVFGWGNSYEAINYDLSMKSGMGNGFSDFILKNGLFGLFTWGLGCYLLVFCSNRQKLRAYTFLAICLIPLFGEIFLAYPLYLSLMFCGFLAAKQTRGQELTTGA